MAKAKKKRSTKATTTKVARAKRSTRTKPSSKKASQTNARTTQKATRGETKKSAKKASASKKGIKRTTRKSGASKMSKVIARSAKRAQKQKALQPEVLDPEVIPLPEPKESGQATQWESKSYPEPIDTPALSPSDPLKQYLLEISRYPLLDKDEELFLTSKMLEGDIAAAKTLVSANLRLVVKIAFEYRSLYANILDLVQEGNVGLMKAVAKFDPSKGARLGYYASWWIRSYILKYLLDNFRLVKIGTTQAQKKLFYHLMKEKQRLEAQGLLAGPKLLAEKLDVKEKDVIEMEQRLSASGAEMPLDAPVRTGGDESAGTFLDFISDPAESVDSRLEREQMVEIIKARIPSFRETLNEKEQKVLDERILSENPRTLQEIANDYDLTRERVRQIEAKIVLKLKGALEEAT